jgi:hypothetical protein
MSNVTLKHKVTNEPISLPCETWEAWSLVPELKAAYEVVEGSAGCKDCGIDPEIESKDAPQAKSVETKVDKSAAKNTSKDGE